MKSVIVVLDDGTQIHLGDLDYVTPLSADTQARAILKAVRYILGTPEGGSILESAILASRRAKEWQVLKRELEELKNSSEVKTS